MDILERAFTKMGARVKFEGAKPRLMGGQWVRPDLALDVRTDTRGEYFLIAIDREAVEELIVLDVQPGDRHLVLMSRGKGERSIAFCLVMTSVTGLWPLFRRQRP